MPRRYAMARARRPSRPAPSSQAGLRGGADLRLDLRAGPGSAGASLAKGLAVIDESGKASLLVSDEHEGKAATLVLLDDADEVVASRPVTVGGTEA